MKRFFILGLILIPLLCMGAEYKKAVTYEIASRLGDSLLGYSHAKWISYKYDIPLLYTPFHYSDQFVLSVAEEVLTPERRAKYVSCRVYDLDQLQHPANEQNILYEILHFPDSKEEHLSMPYFQSIPHIDVDWNDLVFKKMMKEMIAPLRPLNLTIPPKDKISVALHYREGGGYDSVGTKVCNPFHFVSEAYYTRQLHLIRRLVQNAPLYVYIFTDAQNPSILQKKLKKIFPHHVEIHCRSENNSHDKNILEDLFSMMEFDCLIRPCSHYSMTASHLGDFKIEVYPINISQEGIEAVHVEQKAFWDKKNNEWY